LAARARLRLLWYTGCELICVAAARSRVCSDPRLKVAAPVPGLRRDVRTIIESIDRIVRSENPSGDAGACVTPPHRPPHTGPTPPMRVLGLYFGTLVCDGVHVRVMCLHVRGASARYCSHGCVCVPAPPVAVACRTVCETLAVAMLGDREAAPIEALDVIVPQVLTLLTCDRLDVVFDALRAVVNVAAGKSEHTALLVRNGAVRHCLPLIDSTNAVVQNFAVWALGNIAGDGGTAREAVRRRRRAARGGRM
jgi:hypothetical protein